MKVFFVRHAEAANAMEGNGDDLSRPLTPDGRKTAKKIFKALAEVYSKPDAVISSEALRAQETADILAESFGLGGKKVEDTFNPGCRYETFVAWLRKNWKSNETVAIVGHEPDISSITSGLTADHRLRIDVKKAAWVEVEVNLAGKGELKALMPPKVFR